ncbi:DUF3431 domain-containing protein [Marinomonas posidonica]|uniref:Uncharacterized protein n=1 Tax=Marinomonas posidonica (strain CECT 7376 / NCIMB 14433 / IVIA-Po-181) TaxID=491952 RepID=F6CZ91_MARPP|nr:DUF3431 domain-containing protein [Marinomonas posidonica]AEF53547.1 hypothetical protein Mar181_0485 [Marinomonas posidonica IVIA-Po-181]
MKLNIDDIFWVITNYNTNPEELIENIGESYCIYDKGIRGVPDYLQAKGKYKKTNNTGHNISDYLDYIIENYHSLPNRVGFVKGNIFPRHISKENFFIRIKEEGFVPLYHEEKTFRPQFHRFFRWIFVSQHIAPGYYMELANNWYCRKYKRGSFFPNLEGFMEYFLGMRKPKYITFVPGACMIVTKENILRWPIEFYKELYRVVTYDFFPVEAYHAERCMLYIFNYPKE